MYSVQRYTGASLSRIQEIKDHKYKFSHFLNVLTLTINTWLKISKVYTFINQVEDTEVPESLKKAQFLLFEVHQWKQR